jgi:hypothetical protein
MVETFRYKHPRSGPMKGIDALQGPFSVHTFPTEITGDQKIPIGVTHYIWQQENRTIFQLSTQNGAAGMRSDTNEVIYFLQALQNPRTLKRLYEYVALSTKMGIDIESGQLQINDPSQAKGFNGFLQFVLYMNRET